MRISCVAIVAALANCGKAAEQPLPPVTSPPPSEHAFVWIHVAGTPDGTEVFGPFGRLGVAPGDIQLPRGHEAVQLTFSADRYITTTEIVTPTRDDTLVVTLVAKPPPMPPPPPPVVRKPPSPPVAARSALRPPSPPPKPASATIGVATPPFHDRVLVTAETRCPTHHQCDILEVLDLHTRAASQDKGFDELRARAASLNADAVIGAEFEHGEGAEPSHLSGIIVRYAPSIPPHVDIGVLDIPSDEHDDNKGLIELMRRAHAMGGDQVIDVTFEHGENGAQGHLRGTVVRYTR
jgi:uncharacterized protein YbjQ (UPF0145 family)